MSTLSSSDILQFLSGRRDSELFAQADAEKTRVFGRDIFLRGIVEFSNHCRNRCQYCGLRAPNTELTRYRISRDDILLATRSIADMGLGTVVLQSGDDFHFSAEEIGGIIRQIKAERDIAVTLSLGDRSREEFALWRDCGADRYLLKIETTALDLFRRCRPGARFDERLRRIESLQELGYEVGSGIITGLPGMTHTILAQDILQLSKMGLDMIAAGPFVPHPQTPFANEAPGDVDESNRVTALLRLLNPGTNIPATSALDALRPGSRIAALKMGCNVVMPSFTPQSVRAAYNIYPGKNMIPSPALQIVESVRSAISELGLVPSTSQGFSRRNA
ncbi:[FeFe] hydrogenase H-cluster radical SAM maturase HydE [Desulfobaculum bizertense]|uniref:Iron-only hydrogenase maturation protein HydE n=1 Tax=Desulfobaculum bizertense DSM 18034 TaxID=1121442 RepID=A0A1T4WRC2_9BACT|nr:[FeFe] hydrogenase H-cluster radical SAM maturase HydE [Desulfobaculum bizertense]SKA79904.1 iron-only hydrogenase maturation protein HydE [Desulfobaculum bizertense DSM 18034]